MPSSCSTVALSVPVALSVTGVLPDAGPPRVEQRGTGLKGRRLLVLAMATALGSLSIDLYLPAFPELAADLQTSQAAVQITLTACVIGLAVGQLVAGPLSDSFGRRAPMALGLLGWSLASVLCAFAPSIETFTALRFAQGLAMLTILLGALFLRSASLFHPVVFDQLCRTLFGRFTRRSLPRGPWRSEGSLGVSARRQACW